MKKFQVSIVDKENDRNFVSPRLYDSGFDAKHAANLIMGGIRLCLGKNVNPDRFVPSCMEVEDCFADFKYVES